MKMVKVVTTVPMSHADQVRQAAGNAGAGQSEKYSHASFSSKGIGRFLPQADAHPAVGTIGQYEAVEEERIEWRCEHSQAKKIVEAIKNAHPYEEPVIDVYPLEDI